MAIAGSDCKLVNDGRHGTECCKVGSFIGTGQHFFIRRRGKKDTKGFSALLTGFGKGLVSIVAHLGSDAYQVLHLTSVRRLTLISIHLSECSALNVTDRRLAQLFSNQFFPKGHHFPINRSNKSNGFGKRYICRVRIS